MTEHHYRARLQEVVVGGLRTPIGGLVARPWFDAVALRLVADWFFPLSRLWAAARAADGSVDQFFATAGLDPTPRLVRCLGRRLDTFEVTRRRVVDVERDWEAAFFGPDDRGPAARAAVERTRLEARDDYNSRRGLFVPIRLAARVSPVRWDIPAPSAAATIYDELVADPARAYAPPEEMPEIAESRAVARRDGGRSYWLRFRSPSVRMNDQVVARVYEPAQAENAPTVIFGHGICVEFDHWRGVVDEVEAMVAMGIRVVRPEAPWHGRRVLPGRYGGEQFIATAPLGALDHFTAAAREWSVLIDHFRRAGDAPIGIGGSSLGAMTAQIIAEKSQYWPSRLRPDATLLITHCGQIEDAVVRGSLAKTWGIAEATEAEGWDADVMRHYMPLLHIGDRPAMAPETIVTVLGDRDNVTPFDSAKMLIDDWGIPAENRFISRRGHFSVPVGMMRDQRPLMRFRTILDRLSNGQ
jgi:pimeloyl-ACP methyl ester carboxylesterase